MKDTIDDVVLKNTKSTFGIKNISGKKYFFKKTNNINEEIEGYNKVKSFYIVPKILFCENNEIIFEYKKDLKEKTLHEYLYNEKIKFINYKKIFKQYEKSINSLVIKEEKFYRNSDFFIKRVNLLDKYLKSNICEKKYIYKNKQYDVKKIIDEIKSAIKSKKTIKGFLSLGDPTDTNISTTGIFTDFECAGYNSVLGEIAIMFISLTTHGSYFYPKYNASSYLLRTKLLYEYSSYKQSIVYFDDIDNNCVLLPKYSILKKNKEVVLKFLKFYNSFFKDDMEINKYLKYYILMRILTPLDITKMEEYDLNVILSLLIEIYINCNNINSLIDIVNNMEVKKNG